MKSNQKGQIIIILLLIIAVALAIGLSIAGRSMNEISTSTKTEDSARAFSAAEAGLERAFQKSISIGVGTTSILAPILSNNASSEVTIKADIPQRNYPLEYPIPFGKADFAQFWFADPITLARSYENNSFYVYFGNPQDYSTNKENAPAVEITLITAQVGSGTTAYSSQRFFFDSNTGSPSRMAVTGTSDSSTDPNGYWKLITNEDGHEGNFYRRGNASGFTNTATNYPVMARVRFLYTNLKHPVALGPCTTCTLVRNLPPQVALYESQGKAGSTERTLQVFQQKNILPSFLDFVLFSGESLSK